ncbi:hypothetical protein [uncultured Draconibacterium sp.]|uniref:hypothetical protein n=1 Tax=uncultured Draconibacterium sp. TaxID=1573823 RepID=UPI002AA6F85B|nr:hypothetical protein [uncultured Draconibacterium sp.]
MKAKKTIIWLIYICIIAFSYFSCVPSAENATSSYGHDGDYMFIGLYHGAIIPFSIIGKIIGFDIGLIDRGKMDDVTYMVGYVIACYYHYRIIKFIVLGYLEHRKIINDK